MKDDHKHWGTDIKWQSVECPDYVRPADLVMLIDPAAPWALPASEVRWEMVKVFCLDADHVHYFGRQDPPGLPTHFIPDPEKEARYARERDEITLINEHGKIVMELDCNTATHDVLKMLTQMLLGLTYGQRAIIDALRDVAEELEA